jgi:LPXTG-motif cell wall-anchored protein
MCFCDASTMAAASSRATTEFANQAGDPSDGTVTGNSCHGVFNGDAPGSLVETTSVGPNGSTVSPGQTVQVTLLWNPNDFAGNTPDKVDDCVEIGTVISASLSSEHKPAPSGGTDRFSFIVPSGGTGGQQICVRSAISGEKSAVLCYTVMAAVAPEVPTALLLPVAGLLLVGGAFLFARRRNTRTSTDA